MVPAHRPGSAAFAAQQAAALLGVLLQHGSGPDEVTEVLRRFGEPEPIDLAEADVRAMRRVCPDLRAVFAARDTATAARHLNGLLARYASVPRLSAHSGAPWHLHADGDDDGPWDVWFATSCAMALAALLADRQAPPGELCDACGAPFIDSGQGGTRRFCSPRCATRSRVAAHRRRQRLGLGSQP